MPSCSSYLPLLMIVALIAGCASGPREEAARYVCDNEQTITVVYRGADTAILQMGPRQVEMTSAAHPIGQRYVGRQLQWVTQMVGDERIGTLFTRGYDGGPGEVAEQCREVDRD